MAVHQLPETGLVTRLIAILSRWLQPGETYGEGLLREWKR
jgi:hypothetical protein